MTDTATGALIAAVGSLIVAFISGGIALLNRRKTNANSLDIESMKGSVGRDLARLNAKLSHGQLISSTQWNVEFAAYQAIWKELVAVRSTGPNLVIRESELSQVGMSVKDLSYAERIELRTGSVKKFAEVTELLLHAIHDNAPFYPAAIRESANETHAAAKKLLELQLSALIHFSKGVDITVGAPFITDNVTQIAAIVDGVSQVEALIRERLAAVQVVNSAVADD